jgi:hypothetical protein
LGKVRGDGWVFLVLSGVAKNYEANPPGWPVVAAIDPRSNYRHGLGHEIVDETPAELDVC